MRAVPIVRFLSSACSLAAFIAFAAPTTASATPAPIAPAPVATYGFDEGSGTTAHDYAGNHNGTIEGGATWTPQGKYGSAIHFDGINDVVSIADAPQLELTNTFTLEAWVMPEASGGTYTAISKAETTGGFSGYKMSVQSNGTLGASTGNAGATAHLGGSSALPLKAWSHVAFTSDGTTLRLYVNGELIASETALAAKATTAALKIGSYVGSAYFNGLIDEVRIYDQALSQSQIEADRLTPIPAPAPKPVAAYGFDEGSGTAAEDSAATHDGTIEGGATWVKGKYGSALDFDGVNDAVSIPDANELDLTKTFTLEAWVHPDSVLGARPVISKRESFGSGYIGYLLKGESGAPLGGAYATGSSATVSGSTLTAGAWTHLAFTSDGTTLRLYKEGELVASAPAVSAATNGVALMIGASQLQHFEGLIDEVRIYDVALSQGQIEADRKAPIGDPHDVRREGAAENRNFHLDGTDDYRVDADIAVLFNGSSTPPPEQNVVHQVDCTYPNPLLEFRGTFIPPDLESPAWEPDETLNESFGSLPYGPYGCLDNAYDTTEQWHSIGARGDEIDGSNGLGGIAPGARQWEVRTLTESINFAAYRNPKSLPENPEYDPKAPEYLPEVGTAQMVAGLDWVANHADQIDIAYLDTGCVREGTPLEIKEKSEQASGRPAIECDEPLLKAAVARAIDAGVIVITAASEAGSAGQYASPQYLPEVLNVAAVIDTDGKPGGQGAPNPCKSAYPDDTLRGDTSIGTQVDIDAALSCGDSGGDSLKVAGAAAALASECHPTDRAGVEFIIDTLMAQGDTGEISEGGWKDTSGDGWKEPLLNLSDEEVFDPVLEDTATHKLNHEAPEGCQWRSHQAASDINSDGRADLVAINTEAKSAEVLPGTRQGFDTAKPSVSQKGQLDSALLDGKGAYEIDAADVTGDRHADLISAVSGEGVFVRPGNGEGGFGEAVKSLSGITLRFDGKGSEEPIAVADVNGDGYADLVTQQSPSNHILTYPGQANGTFGAAIDSGESVDSALLDGEGNYFLDVTDVSGEKLDEATPVDYNARHSYADLVTLNTDGHAYVFKGQPNGKFAAPLSAAAVNPIFDDGKGAEPVGLGDVNRDRHADLLTLEGETLKLYLGRADGSFAEPTQPYAGKVDSNFTDGKGSELIGLADYSRDGLADLVALSESGEILTYTAQRDKTFAAPEAQGGKLESTRKSKNGREFLAEKPLQRRIGCTGAGCPWALHPLAAYSFNQSSGTTLNDSTAAHNGTIEGGATWSKEGKYGSALSFDGVNDLVSIPDANELDLTGAFTLEAWVLPADFTKTRPIISKSESPTSGYLLNAETNGKPKGRVAAAGTIKAIDGTTALSTTSWTHLALTSDGANLRLYVNGELTAGPLSALAVKETAAKLELGHSSLLGTWFKGKIDEVRIYDAQLSRAQIRADRDAAL